MEDDLFVLKNQNSDSISYYCKYMTSSIFQKFYLFFITAINKGDIKDAEMNAIMDTIVESLFSVFVTMGKM